LFTIRNLKEKAEFVLNTKFNTRDNYMIKYGYKNTSIRLASFCSEHINLFKNYSMVGFAGTEHIMRTVNTG